MENEDFDVAPQTELMRAKLANEPSLRVVSLLRLAQLIRSSICAKRRRTTAGRRRSHAAKLGQAMQFPVLQSPEVLHVSPIKMSPCNADNSEHATFGAWSHEKIRPCSVKPPKDGHSELQRTRHCV